MSAKQHHYLPITYLKGFASDAKQEKVYRYNERSKDLVEASIRTICKQNRLYEIEDADGKKSNEIEEDFFANNIEPIFPHLLESVDKRTPLNNTDVADLAIFMSLQIMRLPTSMKVIEEMQRQAITEQSNIEWAKLLDDDARKQVVEKYRKEVPGFKGELTRDDIQGIIDGTKFKTTLNVPKNNVIKASLELGPMLADRFCRMDWNFMFAQSGSAFITTDLPVTVMVPVQGGWQQIPYGGHMLPNAVTLFPLSKDICIALSNKEYSQHFTDINKRLMRQTNKIIAGNYNQYLISHSENLLHSLTPKPEQ